ncbi:trace amine-associated receptor 6-like [Pygocentrus nattereri]|uniref:trace amine-associated receptor 6-like n=1 Tax=Pygocentrus nattereri TaxID=42514 RepID=UPI0018919E5D|nr:trace amine-associated receptor 6-like [Pygocentrus nattereri]
MESKHYSQNITVQYCFPYINSSCRKEVRTGSAYIFLFFVLSCVSVFTVFLNLLLIISISHFKQLHTPTNLLILSLAVADLLVGMFVMPVNIMQLIDSCWYLGEMACTVSLVVSFMSISGSLCSLVLIAVDRYIAVTDPLLYSMKITVCKTVLLIIIVAQRQAKAVKVVMTGASNKHGAQSSNVSETKAAKTLSITVFVYLACYIPYYIGSLTDSNLTSSSMVWTVFIWLIYMTSSFNPLIYAIFYPWFRASVKYVLTCKIFGYSSSRLNLFPKHV